MLRRQDGDNLQYLVWLLARGRPGAILIGAIRYATCTYQTIATAEIEANAVELAIRPQPSPNLRS
jgi:hypothetical protein